MQRLKETEKNTSRRTRRPARPRPELGRNRDSSEPVDLSKYIGPDGDPQKTFEKLQELGTIPSPPHPPGATDTSQDMWKDMPIEKRMAYAKDLLQRREYEAAQKELEAILEEDLKKDNLLQALTLREKNLFHQKYYDVVEDDYYRLKSYYPDNEHVKELKTYLDKESGLEPLQNSVKSNPADPAKQRQLLDLYQKYGWLDFVQKPFRIHPKPPYKA